MSEELREYTDLYNKYLKGGNYNLLNLMIIDEIECQTRVRLKDEDYNKLFYKVKNCYLKSDSIDLWSLVHYCLDNLEDLEDLDTWFIINHSQV